MSVVLAGLAAIDASVREHLATLLTGNTSELEVVGGHVWHVTRQAVTMVGDYRAANVPLAAFAVVAFVLFLFAFRL